MNHSLLTLVSKAFAYLMVSSVFLYLINNYLVYWQGLPGPYQLLVDPGLNSNDNALSEQQIFQGWMQVAAYLSVLLVALGYALKNTSSTLVDESKRFENLAAYLIRVAFWSVLLIGIIDAGISFLRIEKILDVFVNQNLVEELGRPIFRGSYVHYPIIVGSLVFAWWFKKINFSWLALLVVLAEFLIVITRFIFSYEQAFMGDLVRFWYASLFLFASAYTLVHEGHVRVDVLYTNLKPHIKALSNIIGSLILGMPLCWVILMQGMGGRGNSINSPLLSFEISQSGYGMYVKYLMVGFMAVFALTMLIQFVSFLLKNLAIYIGEVPDEVTEDTAGHPGSVS